MGPFGSIKRFLSHLTFAAFTNKQAELRGTTPEYLYLEERKEKTPNDELARVHLEKGLWSFRRLYERCEQARKKYKAAGVTPDDVRSLEDFQKIPFLTKRDFLDAYPTGMLCVDVADVVRLHCTSGTSGNRPTTGFYTMNDLEAWTTLTARNLVCVGCTREDVFQNTTSSGLFTGGFGYTQGATRVGMMVIPFGGGMTEKQIQFFKDFGVTAIHAIPSFGLRIAEVAEKIGVDPREELRLRIGIFGAEGWSEATRKRIQDGLGVKAYDNYGLTEACGPGVAVECPEQAGMHVWSDHFYPEVVDPDTGEVLPEGEVGELVLTSLFKEAVPIFRYRTGDITRLWRSDCACGRTGYVIDRILGRVSDFHVIKGVNLYPSQIEEEIFKVPEATDTYLIIFQTVGVMDQVTVQVEARPGADKGALKEKLEKALYLATMMKIPVTVFDEGTLPRQEGKAIRVKDTRERPEGFKGWEKIRDKYRKTR
ncbi:MAG: phenylacetate--CoA ligase [Promethearchaeota archaeon]